ncbi:hypothetical protein IAI18_19135 [Acetobacteraceae bacterium H6797]|nr:hypothetical protein [Acetobacteraceae bacterium H6797]
MREPLLSLGHDLPLLHPEIQDALDRVMAGEAPAWQLAEPPPVIHRRLPQLDLLLPEGEGAPAILFLAGVPADPARLHVAAELAFASGAAVLLPGDIAPLEALRLAAEQGVDVARWGLLGEGKGTGEALGLVLARPAPLALALLCPDGGRLVAGVNWPPILLILAEPGVQGDELARHLMRASAPVTALRYLGAPDGFATDPAMAGCGPGRQAMAQVAALMREELARA